MSTTATLFKLIGRPLLLNNTSTLYSNYFVSFSINDSAIQVGNNLTVMDQYAIGTLVEYFCQSAYRQTKTYRMLTQCMIGPYWSMNVASNYSCEPIPCNISTISVPNSDAVVVVLKGKKRIIVNAIDTIFHCALLQSDCLETIQFNGKGTKELSEHTSNKRSLHTHCL